MLALRYTRYFLLVTQIQPGQMWGKNEWDYLVRSRNRTLFSFLVPLRVTYPRGRAGGGGLREGPGLLSQAAARFPAALTCRSGKTRSRLLQIAVHGNCPQGTFAAGGDAGGLVY